MSVNTSHIYAIDQRRGRDPTRAERNANTTKQAKENIREVALMSV